VRNERSLRRVSLTYSEGLRPCGHPDGVARGGHKAALRSADSLAHSLVASVPFSPPAIGEAEAAEVAAVLASGWLTTGPRVRRFEREFAAYVGAPYAVALNSCTAALHLALLASGVGRGDEVITTPLTFCATANVIEHCGATPVFADVNPATGNLDPAAVEAAITPATRAIIPVHYAGRPADIGAFRTLATSSQLTIIEDAAHCVEGASRAGKVGATADFTCFSFYATKNLTTGEGGMVTTPYEDAAEWMRIASLHGLSRDAWKRYERPGAVQYDVTIPGFKYNMTDLSAALGLHQLAGLEARYERRRAIWRRYDEAFADLPLTRFAPMPAGERHALHLYTIQIDPALAGRSRDEVAAALGEAGINTSIHFTALHLHSFYAKKYGFERGAFPAAERISDSILSLPFSAGLSDEQVAAVIAAVRGVLGAS